MGMETTCKEHISDCVNQECFICDHCKTCIRKCTSHKDPYPYGKIFSKKIYEEYVDIVETDQEANEQRTISLNKMLRDQARPHKGWGIQKTEKGLYQVAPMVLYVPLVRTSWQMSSIVLQYSGLKGSAKLVAATIATYYNKNWGICYPSYNRLMDDTGFSRSTIADAISKMKTSGEWLIGQRQGRRYNHYIPYLGICSLPKSSSAKGSYIWCPPPCTYKYGGSASKTSRQQLADELNSNPFAHNKVKKES